MAIVADNASIMARSVKKFNKMDDIREVEANEDDRGLDKVFYSALSGMADFLTTTHMRCAMHTLQLAILDDLKEKHVIDLSVKSATLL